MNDNQTLKAYEAFNAAVTYKQPRIEAGTKNLDLYNLKANRDEKVGFLNIPTTDMTSFVDDWVARMPKLNIKFKALKSLADADAERKINALFERDSSPQFADYLRVKRGINKYACIYGKGIGKVWADSVNGYQPHFACIDPVDFFDQPNGPADIEQHEYCGETSIFKTKTELLEGVKQGFYDDKAVKAIIAYGESNGSYIEQTRYDYQQKIAKFKSVNVITPKNYFDPIFHFFEIYYQYEGERWYELIETQTGISIRQKKLSKITKSNLYPYVCIYPKEDIHNSWPISPADIKRPSALMMQEAQNAFINNMRQLVRPARAYKPEAFDRPPKYLPDNWIPLSTGTLVPIDQAIQRLDVADLTTPILRFIDYQRNTAGLDTGITTGMQGVAETDKVGINERNIQQATRKLNYSNESDINFAIGVGLRWLWGARENLTNDVAVKIMGKLGLDTVKVLKSDAEPDFDIIVEDGEEKRNLDEIQAQKTMIALNHPVVVQTGNPKKLGQMVLKVGAIADNDIQELMESDAYGEAKFIEKAENVFQQFLENKTPELWRSANNVFMQRLYDQLQDNRGEIKPNIIAKIEKYLEQSAVIAQFNAKRQAELDMMKAEMEGAKQFMQNPQGLPIEQAPQQQEQPIITEPTEENV